MRKRKTANRDSDGTTPEPESHHEQHEEEESKPTVTPQSPTEENIFDDISQLSDYSQYSDEDSDQSHTANRDSDGTTPEPESHHEQHQEEEEESKPTVTPQSPTEENIADEDDDDISPPYYEQYSEEDRDLQLAIIASLKNPTPKRRKLTETGESCDEIDPLSFTCEICVEPKSYLDFFHIIGCTHTYCSDCIIKYVASKLQENIPQIRCPVSGCGGLLEPEHCRTILPPELFDSWENLSARRSFLDRRNYTVPTRIALRF
ncbi:E3 ubiquitin-protein ligase dbl4-like [Cornus florida]|uniref:E3 ubiquitin-protein ligase dbl4-like n=1 Tax=Cornus florida TaxID=4283 RepID=UPI0028A13C4C|nr:E3 ubiquitin-protein ligase dbl4-like [Cornus florida]